MDKNVIISLKGNQGARGYFGDDLELVTEGRYYKKEGAYYITYNESEVTGMEGTTTTLKIHDGVITLMRTGAVNAQFVFERGRKHLSYYDTAYGAFTVGVFTNDLNINIDENGGEIWVDYKLEIDNNKTGENDFYMQIREVGQTNDKCCG